MPISETLKVIIAAVATYFSGVSIPGYTPMQPYRADSITIDSARQFIAVYANEAVCSQPLSHKRVDKLYGDLQNILPEGVRHYCLRIYSSKNQYELRQLVPFFVEDARHNTTSAYPVKLAGTNPWLKRESRPFESHFSLTDKHLMITPSHGRYYKYGDWHWQRPNLNATNEDLVTQDIVFPFLIPMLERAGAVVSTCRERDIQTHECVMDNDAPSHHGLYEEFNGIDDWQTAEGLAFGCPTGMLTDSIEPFTLGTARFVHTTSMRSTESACPSVIYTPKIPKSGKYAVYISYVTLPASVSDAHYVVRHCGVETHFRVNQQMGEKTWLYLGTFYFEEGIDPSRGSVCLYADSRESGFVSTDAVRFGGGIGQTMRGADAGASGVPRRIEGARYYTHWSGLPLRISLYEDNDNDYNDDIRSRSRYTNYLAGGSTTLPDHEGLGVPLSLALSLHTDAGLHKDNTNVGSLTICTTNRDDEPSPLNAPLPDDETILAIPRLYPSGLSRQASRDFADLTIQGLQRDLSAFIGKSWNRREIFDRNYGETRTPSIPSIIVEGLSHENFADMRYGHDPNFRFAFARSLYKSVARMVCHLHNEPEPTIQPLPVGNLTAQLNDLCDSVTISWTPTADMLEPSAEPTDYVIYIANGEGRDFDNGQLTSRATTVRLPLKAGKLYRFRVSAINAGGESLPSHTLYAYRSTQRDTPKVWLADGFDRLSGPAFTDDYNPKFDLKSDIGVPYLQTLGLLGDIGGINGTLTGRVVAGNDGNILSSYASALAKADHCSFASGTSAAIEAGFGLAAIREADAVLYAAGQNADFRHNIKHYDAIAPQVCQLLGDYASKGGNLIVTGQFVASQSESHAHLRTLLSETFGTAYLQTLPLDSLGETRLYDTPNAEHYFVPRADILCPKAQDTEGKTCRVWAQYSDGSAAAVAHQHKNSRTILFAYPLDAIRDKEQRETQIADAVRHVLRIEK